MAAASSAARSTRSMVAGEDQLGGVEGEELGPLGARGSADEVERRLDQLEAFLVDMADHAGEHRGCWPARPCTRRATSPCSAARRAALEESLP